MRKCKALLLGAVFVATALGASAHATTIAFGEVASPAGFSIGNDALSGAFEDAYTFSIAPDLVFDFTALASTGFSNRVGIADFSASLFQGTNLLRSVDAIVRTLPEGFPSSDIVFESITLEAGDYSFLISGTAFSAFPGPTSSYSGTVSFATAPSVVTEPGTLFLFTLGLGALGFVRRSNRSRLGRSERSNA
jgi:hypothetical protein